MTIEAGLLLGVGAAVKTVPILMLPTLVAYSRSRAEAVRVTCASLLVPAIVLVPLWLGGVNLHYVFAYAGVPGFGGMSLAADPALGWHEITVNIPFQYSNGLTLTLLDASRWITLAALTAHLVFVRRFRPALADAFVLLWVVIYAFSPNFFLNYIVWGLPFFLMAGYLKEVALLQLALLAPTIAFYVSLWPNRTELLGYAYVPMMVLVWVGWLLATGVLAGRIARSDSVAAGCEHPPLVDVARA